MVKGNMHAESILGMRPTRNGPLYLVKWRDQHEDNTWLPLTALSDCLELVVAFERRNSRKTARKTANSVEDFRANLHLETWIEVKDDQEEIGLVEEIVHRQGRSIEVRREGRVQTEWTTVKDLTAVQPLKVIAFLVAELRKKDLKTTVYPS